MTHPILASFSTPFDVEIRTLKSFQQQSYADDHGVDETDEHGRVVSIVGCVVVCVLRGAEGSYLCTGICIHGTQNYK